MVTKRKEAVSVIDLPKIEENLWSIRELLGIGIDDTDHLITQAWNIFFIKVQTREKITKEW